ncbi:polyphosphate polymerase domain-containing protein [Faecalicatena sp. Marseille-Q4148]|nr:polyphosphate polymerase domain-containing protein [Faecalicatena sp. Marseille-Q4148]
MAQTVFNRYEKKYLMPETVYEELRTQLKPYMEEDQYGLHTICNIYYDTPDDLLIRRSIEKPKYKEKLRLRSYGIPGLDSKVFLEIKKKYRKVVNKRRIELTLQEAYDYVEKGIHPNMEGQIINEIDFFLKRYPLEKSLYLAYDRIALFGKEDSQFRITFDQNIRSRRNFVGLENGDWGELLLPKGFYLMESKIMGATPLWFTKLLSDLDIYSTSFSKYGNIYKIGNCETHEVCLQS